MKEINTKINKFDEIPDDFAMNWQKIKEFDGLAQKIQELNQLYNGL